MRILEIETASDAGYLSIDCVRGVDGVYNISVKDAVSGHIAQILLGEKDVEAITEAVLTERLSRLPA